MRKQRRIKDIKETKTVKKTVKTKIRKDIKETKTVKKDSKDKDKKIH